MTYYKVYRDEEGAFRIRFKGGIAMDVGGFNGPKEVESYLGWCRGTRWNEQPLRPLQAVKGNLTVNHRNFNEKPIAEPSAEVQELIKSLNVAL